MNLLFLVNRGDNWFNKASQGHERFFWTTFGCLMLRVFPGDYHLFPFDLENIWFFALTWQAFNSVYNYALDLRSIYGRKATKTLERASRSIPYTVIFRQ